MLFLFGIVIGFIICIGIHYLMTKESDQSSRGSYKRAAVATDTPQCSQIGKDILDVNGSAVDAAIAAMFCLGVVSMHSSGIGGGGVMLVYNRSLHEAKVIDFRETAPAQAYGNMFKGNVSKSKKGGLSIAVPGEVRGQREAWERYGWLPWGRLVQPAIDLARNGFEITQAVEDALKTKKGIEQDIRNDPGLSELLLDKDGKLRKQGDKIKNEKYAQTLEKVQDDPESFYSGPLASDIVQDIRIINGTVTHEDLRKYKSISREPYESKLSGMKMYLTPPPTSGPVLALILNILKGYNMMSWHRNDVNSSVLTYHRIVESFKFSYAWRSRLGDPAFNPKIDKVAKEMLKQETGDRIRHKIRDSMTYKDVSYYADSFSDADYGTTHLAVLAPNGDAVSVTTTINMRFGCKYRSMTTGIIYNNEMADFDTPDNNIVDGISPSPFNFPEPGKRPFSSMSPAILIDGDGKVKLVIGASGGKRITTAVSLVLMNKLWFGQSLSDAVDEPRLHTQLVPDQTVFYEKDKKYRLSEEIVEGLRKRGHDVMAANPFAVVQAVFRDPTGKGIYAKSDPRKHGAPAGQ
ncbi:hypothetical protein OS493_000997 [Desmophyllum pertusum]|uniref:Gamma-glutamyltranspeptidase 1 n=1 Tax=Desmophyllum pertusum TaxID=174260 RepID=A0A9X0D5J0_9CNID|nr:hypothetical protein OS493_000997 [Desmophyllum pertusum]